MLKRFVTSIAAKWQDLNMSWRKLVFLLTLLFIAGGLIPFCWTIIAAWVAALSG